MMIRPSKYKAKVIEHTQLTETVYATKFKPLLIEKSLGDSQKFTYLPGQFVTITVNEKQRRSYSLSSSPDKTDYLETIVDISPNGPGSQFFAKLSKNDEFEFIGPLGSFGLEKNTKDSGYDIFLATGTGITPFLSMIESRILTNSQRKIILYWGLRHETDIYLQDRLNKLQLNSNFEYFICLSQPIDIDNWQNKGLSGYVQHNYHANRHLYSNKLTDYLDNHYYICGGREFIQETTKLLSDNGIEHNQISSEKFF